MALVFSPVNPVGTFPGGRRDLGKVQTDVTLDGTSYSSGFPVTAANLGMLAIDGVQVISQSGATYTSMTTASWDNTNSKIRLGKGLVEAVAGDFTTSMKIRVEATGTPLL